MKSMISRIKNWVKQNDKDIQATYHHLHELAEVSWRETKTTAFLCQQLDRLGIAYQTFRDRTGVVALWKEKKTGSTVGLRADMDALWQNVDGVWKANHSCGHDAHMAMVLNTLRCLKEIGFQPNGCLKVIFQPAEETGEGAKFFLRKGVIDDINSLLGIHLRPIQELSFGQASPAIYHGAVTLLKGRVKGEQAHASRPNLGINTVDSIASIVAAVNAVKANPTIPMSAKVTRVSAGGQNLNIIPDEAEFGIDIRAQTNEAMDELLDKVKKAVLSAGRANGADVEVEIAAYIPASKPNRWLETIVGEAIVEVLGPDALKEPPVTPGGDDFHFYTKEKQHLNATMIGLGADLFPGLHHPKMAFNLSSLSNGVAILSATVLKLFEKINTRDA